MPSMRFRSEIVSFAVCGRGLDTDSHPCDTIGPHAAWAGQLFIWQASAPCCRWHLRLLDQTADNHLSGRARLISCVIKRILVLPCAPRDRFQDIWAHPRRSPWYHQCIFAVFFFGGVQLLAMGVLGEYIGRIYREVKRRPPFMVKSITSQDSIPSHRATNLSK